MSADRPPKTGRKPRADAERNRQKLLDAARSAFTANGGLVSMDEVARTAGVGIGTLYRHFPNRDELVIAVYRNDTATLLDAARQMAATGAPLESLRNWLLLFIDHLGAKIILADAVKALVGDKAKDDAAATEELNASLKLLIERAVESGDLAPASIEPLDLVRAIYGVATASPDANWEESARRMVDILIAGLKQR